jgi:hypothetical protein
VAHPCEYFGQHADYGVILHHEDTERSHRFTASLAPPSFLQPSMRSISLVGA